MYRLLEIGEQLRETDEYYSSSYGWLAWGYTGKGAVYTDSFVPTRRKIEHTAWSAPQTSHNTGMDAIPLWAVRTWLQHNINSNLAIVETKIVEMVGIAEQHHT